MGGVAVAANDGSTNTAASTRSILLDVARLAIVDFMKDWELLASIAFVEPERIVNAAAIVVGLNVLRLDFEIVVAIVVDIVIVNDLWEWAIGLLCDMCFL